MRPALAFLGVTVLLALAISGASAAASQNNHDDPQSGSSAQKRTYAKLRPTAVPPWILQGIHQGVATLEPGVACPVSQVVSGVSQRMKEFVENLQKFNATEHLEHFKVGGARSRGKPETRKFDYVVIITPSGNGGFQLEEYRNGTLDPLQFPAQIATTGLSTLALLFHPIQVSNFSLACEGLGQWDGHPTWLVDFAQRLDRPNQLSGYVINSRNYPVPLKGRAWIDVNSYQVRRLESQMIKPIPEIKLIEQDFAIDYGPVQFRTQGQQLWLPLDAEVYSSQGKHRFYRRHAFSNFKLFQVETNQQIQEPKKSDQ